MAPDRGESVLIVEKGPRTRAETVSQFVPFGLMMAECLVLTVLVFIPEGPKGPANAVAVALLGGLLVWCWPVIAVFVMRAEVRGTWRLDGDGVGFRPTRGEPILIRWKDVEWVRWGERSVGLRSGRTTLALPLGSMDEPARSRARARLESSLKADFDLAIRSWPDPLDGVEPGWWNRTLRAGRIAAVSSVVSAALLVPQFWVATRYPERGAWQAPAVGLGWLALLIAVAFRYRRKALALNPTWRPRLGKVPGDDFGGLF
jgi:hypothetical protein